MKNRLTITLDKKIMEKVDAWAKKQDINNRSSAIESLLKKSLGSEVEKALILAGGKGGVGNLTDNTPKPLIKIRGKPILEWQIDLLKKQGIKDILISIGHMGEKIKKYFGDGSDWGVNINYIEETEPLGTAGPLNRIRHLVKSRFLMLYGDNLFDIDIDDMVRFHSENKAKMTIALKTLPKTKEYGNVVIKGNKVVEFYEKPGETVSNIISTGFFVLEPEIIEYCQDAYSFEKEVLPKLLEKNSVFGYVFTGQWYDIEDMGYYKKASEGWKGIGGHI